MSRWDVFSLVFKERDCREESRWVECANISFTARAYCQIGGFDSRVSSGEDDWIGRELNNLVKTNSEANQAWAKPKFLESTWVATDPRRILAALVGGRTGLEAWSW